MTLNELLTIVSSKGAPRLRTDSRLVRAGDIFIALPGNACDGHDFINKAVEKGAKIIVCQRPLKNESVHTVLVEDSTKSAALLAQAAKGNPSSKLTNLAVTGTNGKTTTAFLLRSCIQQAGEKCGLLSTIVYDTAGETCPAPLTTPDPLTIAEKQYQMLQAGAKYMAIEASSHGLSQNRMAGIDFKAAAFTNLTGDHLDYHKTEKEYLAAKSLLFEALDENSTAVLNKQSPHSTQLAHATKARILWYAIDEPADIQAHIKSMDVNETIFTLRYLGLEQKLKISLLGRHNVSNALAAAGLALSVGFDLKTIAAGLEALTIVPGRLEKVDCDREFTVLIDYAHTDDALKNVLSTLKPLCRGRLIVVFGCGGNRDKTKRPRMATVAEQFADIVIVTSDNPRAENPDDIIRDVIAGFTTHENINVEPDRKQAIELALKNAGKNDVVLIAGKGHETQQIIGTHKFDFNDKQVAQLCLAKPK